MIYTLGRSIQRIERIQMEMATGRRVLRPSDDPPGTIRILSFRRQLEDNGVFQRNIDDGLRWNTATEAALSEVMESLMQLKEIATRAANDATMALPESGFSVDELLNSLLDTGRTRLDHRYLFSGFNSHTAPFEASDGVTGDAFTAGAVGSAVDLRYARIEAGSLVITDQTGGTTFVEGADYTGDYDTGRVTLTAGSGMSEGTTYLADYTTEGTSSVTVADSIEGSIVRRIGPESTVAVNLLATEVFQDGADVFQLAIDLKNALYRDDAGAVNGLLDSVDQAIQHVGELLGVVGSRAQRLENALGSLQSHQIALEAFISGIEDVDLPSAVVRLQSEQVAYETALSVAARLMNISLVDYL